MRLQRTTWDENGVQDSIEEAGQSVVQAIVARRLLGGRHLLCDDTDPAGETDPRR